MMGDAARILAVDDSPTIRKALQLMLEPAGFTLEFGATGQEAIEKVKQFQPQVLLLDFILPDVRGSDVCRLLAADPETAGIPVVLISTKGAEIRQAYQDLDNVVHYITKPFAPDEVMRAINEVLARGAGERLAKMRGEPGAPAAETLAAAVSADHEPIPADGEVPAEAWEEAAEAAGEEDTDLVAADRVRDGARREALEAMFETLRTGLEGVYVEEVDTPAGAAADEAQSYTDLASRLARQLAEAMDQAESGVPFSLCSDGSVRSLDENLLDTFRRVCRLLFRAAGAGAVENELAGHSLPRVLLVSRPDSRLFERLMALRRDCSEWHVFAIAADVRQLPLMTRLYGPTRLIVDAAYGSPLWDQLKTVRALPDGQQLPVLAVVSANVGGEQSGSGAWSALGVETLVDPGAELITMLRTWITHPGDLSRRSAERSAIEPSVVHA
jgi:CheY-like chemotaxis protein